MSDSKQVSEEVISNLVEELTQVFNTTDQVLSEWTGEGNLQFPILLGMIGAKMQWDDKQMREADPFVRKYVRNHPAWHVTRGAHGGIMRASERDKKEAVKQAKELAKKQMKEAIEAKAAAQNSNSADSE
jgi:hypothetical protein